MLDKLRCTDFVPLVGQVFQIAVDGLQPLALTLVSATEIGVPRAPDQRPPFSLMFLGPESRQYLLQGTYHLEHARLSGLELFVVPVGPRAGRMQYEAIFS